MVAKTFTALIGSLIFYTQSQPPVSAGPYFTCVKIGRYSSPAAKVKLAVLFYLLEVI